MQVSILVHLRNDSFTDSLLSHSVPRRVPSNDLIKYLFPNSTSLWVGPALVCQKETQQASSGWCTGGCWFTVALSLRALQDQHRNNRVDDTRKTSEENAS